MFCGLARSPTPVSGSSGLWLEDIDGERSARAGVEPDADVEAQRSR